MTSSDEQYVTFRIGPDEYAVPILQVREIIELPPLTRIPATPAYVRGVFNLVGRVLPVLDLGIKFGFGETAMTSKSCVVVAEVSLDGETAGFGVLIGGIGEVVELPRASVEPPPPFGVPVRLDYLLGVGRHGDRLLLLLDLERVISSLEILGMSRLPNAAIAGAA